MQKCSLCGNKLIDKCYSLDAKYMDVMICPDCQNRKQAIYDAVESGDENNLKRAIEDFTTNTTNAKYASISKQLTESFVTTFSERISKDRNKQESQKRIKEMKLTTGNNFEGYRITEYHDVIFDELIMGTGLATSFEIGIDSVFAAMDGSEFTSLCNRINEIKTLLRNKVIEKAASIGANALIGIDFESSSSNLVRGSIMVSMTATAVTIEKL